jgi:hypothetical protein
MNRKHNYVQTPVPLILDTRLTGNDIRVLVYLAWRQGAHEKTWPGIRTMARELGLDKSTVQLCINKLRRLVYLSVGQIRCPKGKKNTYATHLEVVRKIRTSAYGKSGHNYTTVNKTDPVFEEPVGQKAGTTRKNRVKRTMRHIRKKSNTRVADLHSPGRKTKHRKTKNQSDKEVNHGTK